MADIRKFSGFIAPDGTAHASLAAATVHTRNLKTKQALTGFAETLVGSVDLSSDESGNPVIYPDELPDFLIANRDVILAAFNQEVNMRSPRGSRKKKVDPSTITLATTAAPAKAAATRNPTPAPAPTPGALEPGLIELEE